jgi:hypothetical protein
MLNEERFDLLRLLIRHGARVTVAGETTNNNDDNEDLSTAGSISASLRRRQQASNDGILTIAETSNSMLYPLKAMAAAGNLKACRFLLNETPEFTATAAAADSSPGSLSKTGGSLLNKALYTALVTAAAYNKPQIIEMIAEEFPAYPAAIEDPNRDCLISAVYHNHFDCVRVIKQHYLPRDSIHCDHLLFAIRLSCSNREMLEMLLSVYQFAPGQEHLLLITELLEICCRRGHTDSAEWLTKTQTILSSTIIFDCIRLAAKAGHLATVDRAMQAMERRCTSAATDVTDDISRGSAVLTKYRLRLLAIMMRSIGVNANRDN